MRKLTIIGAGNVGKTLGRMWRQAGCFAIQDILNRSPASAQSAIEFIGAGRAASDYGDLQAADVFLIAVPDSHIASCASLLAGTGLAGSESLVFHCSGALSADVLQPVKHSGAAVASVHPVRSFASPELLAHSFAGTWCGMEGDLLAIERLQPAFEAIGARTVGIPAGSKMLYHAAAVFASNYLVTVLDVALQAYAAAGIPENIARELMAPLVRDTVDNVLRKGPEQALTGPVARRDLSTVLRQYRTLKSWSRSHAALYKQLARHTARLAARRGKKFDQ